MDTFFNRDVDMGERNERRTIVATSEGEELEELQSLGIDVKRKNDLNNKQELEELSSVIKQSMYEDYKLAYGKKGEEHKEEATATVSI